MHGLSTGNGASLLLYTAPVLTFSRVFKKKSTEEFSCFPYVMTLFNCLIYTWYGLPIVSHRWENFPLVTINGVGIVLESIFIFVHFCYASPKEKIKVGVIFVSVIVVFGLTTAISAVVFDDHHHRKSFVGSVGVVASISMYGSPLIVMSPNMVGTPLGILQLIIYFKYKNKEPPLTTTVVTGEQMGRGEEQE
ncbi:hypothetical protein Bca52824_035680 [Brassica carinata]|uniref:Bidirectional sugar transporter SWEET n=1 Tax=Brassica carinata TaxID=52824 RepID=A0A8X7S4R8_BRACI|nr:hypothetical protein Bca52824_035680 [Brassica carinata]